MMDFGELNLSDLNQAEIVWRVPRVIMAMLKNVHLYYVETSHTLEQEGDFWYWKLTVYGLDMMRVLSRSSVAGFAYRETFLQPEIQAIPQIALLQDMNYEIHQQIVSPSYLPNWEHVLDGHPFLLDKRLIIDLDIFAYEMHGLMTRIQEGYYLPSGNCVYAPRSTVKKVLSAG